MLFCIQNIYVLLSACSIRSCRIVCVINDNDPLYNQRAWTETSQQTEQALYSGGLFHSHGQIQAWILCILNPSHFPLIIFISSSSILGASIKWCKSQQCIQSIFQTNVLICNTKTWLGPMLCMQAVKSTLKKLADFLCVSITTSRQKGLSLCLCQGVPLMFTDHISMPLRSAFSTKCLNCGYCFQLCCMREHEGWALL